MHLIQPQKVNTFKSFFLSYLLHKSHSNESLPPLQEDNLNKAKSYLIWWNRSVHQSAAHNGGDPAELVLEQPNKPKKEICKIM